MKRPKGFTLIEFLIYMGLLSIFLVVLTDIFVSILDVKTESEATSGVEEDGRYLLARLSYDISRADSISLPLNLGDTSSNLRFIIGGVTYTYATSSGNLVITDNSGTDNLNSFGSQITNPTFLKVGNLGGKETVKLQFTVSSLVSRPGGPQTKTFQATIGRR